MFDIIKKTMLMGAGLAAMTGDKIEELAKELTEKGGMSEKEGKELVEELVRKSDRARKDLDAKVETLVGKALEKMDVATRKDIARLEEKIGEIEQKVFSDNNPKTSN